MSNFLTNVELRRVLNRDAGTAGTKKAAIVDMKDYDEVTFIVAFQTVVNASKVTFQIAQGDVNNTASMVVSAAKLPQITSDGTEVVLSNKQLAITVTQPMHRYLEAQVVIADQNAPIDHITAVLSKPRKQPTGQGATVQNSAVFQSPGAA